MADFLTELAWALKAPFQARQDRFGGTPEEPPFVPPAGPTSMDPPTLTSNPGPQPAPLPTISPPVRKYMASRAAPQPQEAPLVPEGYGVLQDQPAAPPPQPAPQEAPQGPAIPYFRQRYGWPEGAMDALREAQEKDRAYMVGAGAGASGNIATSLVTGIPIDTAHNYAQAGEHTRQFLERAGMVADEPALMKGQTEADMAAYGVQIQQAMMTPGHPMYRALVAGALKEDPSLREYGINENSPAWLIAQVYGQRKPMVEQQGQKATAQASLASAQKGTAEAQQIQMDNDPQNPAIPLAIQTLAEVNPQAAAQARRTPGITMYQLAKISGPALETWKAKTDLAMKQLTYGMEVAKFNLEVIQKTGAPPGWQLGRTPSGQPYRIPSDSEKTEIAEGAAAAVIVNKILNRMEQLVDKRGLTGLDPDEAMSEYTSLAGQLKLHAPKLWGQTNEKFSKAFEAAMAQVLPTGRGSLYLIGEKSDEIRMKISEIRALATTGLAIRFRAYGLVPSTAGDPPSFREAR